MPRGEKKKGDSIRVFARFRPQNQREIDEGSVDVLSLSQDNRSLSLRMSDDSTRNFSFDHVFGPDSTQDGVFEHTALPIVEDVMSGYNATIFVYGQTGAGKTFTMEGVHHTELRGLIPRTIETIFERIADSPDTFEFTVQVSYVEIYCERIRDLLDSTKQNLRVREDPKRGIYVDGVTMTSVASVQETLDVMELGQENRAVSSTKMNAGSSRSHAVLLMRLTKTDTSTNAKSTSKITLCDLAGSEKVALLSRQVEVSRGKDEAVSLQVRKTGASGQLLEEAKKINQSLSALGNVINALSSEKGAHVRYRDSKLTRLLQDSLGGNAKTSLVVCASPMSFNVEETISTMRFGERAKKVTNKARINAEKTVAEYKRIVRKLESQLREQQQLIEALQTDLGDTGSKTRSCPLSPESDVDSVTAMDRVEVADTAALRSAQDTAAEGSGAAAVVVQLQRQYEQALQRSQKLEQQMQQLSDENEVLRDSASEAKLQRENIEQSLVVAQSKINDIIPQLESRLQQSEDKQREDEERSEKLEHQVKLLQESLQRANDELAAKEQARARLIAEMKRDEAAEQEASTAGAKAWIQEKRELQFELQLLMDSLSIKIDQHVRLQQQFAELDHGMLAARTERRRLQRLVKEMRQDATLHEQALLETARLNHQKRQEMQDRIDALQKQVHRLQQSGGGRGRAMSTERRHVVIPIRGGRRVTPKAPPVRMHRQ
ncbi:MAG: hypothetical protein MHM6MM_003686 [Cercozoa sp. M6MM]